MIEELEDFLRYCRVERRLAPLTCSAYERDVRACHAFLDGEGTLSWAEVRPADLRRFLAAEASSRPASASQARTVAALKGFFRFLLENEAIDRDPAAVLRTPKKREALPDVLNRSELERLLSAVEREDVWERHFPGRRERDRLLLALFAYAGLRRSELLGVDWDDVELGRRLLRVRQAKGGRQRVVPLHPALIPLFVEYLAIRSPVIEPALFVGVQGRRLSVTIMAATFRRLRGPQASRSANGSRPTRSVTFSRRSYFVPAPTCARSRSCSATSTSTPRSATRGLPGTSFAAR